MRQMLKGLFSLGMLLSVGIIVADSCCSTDCSTDCNADCTSICGGGYPSVSFRSQSVNAARELVGWQTLINRFLDGEEKIYGAFTITPEYTRSFKPCRIAGYLFGEDYKTGSLTISGSQKGGLGDDTIANVVARGENEWLAEYFGLPTNFESSVQFTPRVSNFLVDLNLYLGLDEVVEGSFFRIHAPIVYTKWELNPCETVSVSGDNGFTAGYMSSAAIARTSLPENWLAAMKGVTFGDMKEALKYGKIADCKLTKTRLSDIQMALGWNFLLDEDYHFGLMVRAAAPTGNAPDAEYLFSPVAGNSKHWELGGGLTGHARLWTSDDEESWFDFYVDANVSHLFKNKQYYSFDLKEKANSRYMLISELSSTVSGLYAAATQNTANVVAPAYQYTGNLFPLINKTTCCTDVSIAVQGDLAVKFAWGNDSWQIDLGYNLWGRSGLKFSEDCCNDTCCLESKKYALKGDARVYGFRYNATTVVPLSATEYNATINGGTNTPTGTAFAAAQLLNPSIDNAQYAYFVSTGLTAGAVNLAPSVANDNYQLKTSKDPKFLSCDDLNICTTPSALSHKIFGHVNYMWRSDDEEDEWMPFIGLGGEVEFSGKSDDSYSALSQWGVWLKGGLSFN